LTAARDNGISGEVMSEIMAFLEGRVLFDEPLSRHTYIGAGGPASVLCRVKERKALSGLVALAGRNGIPLVTLGMGSNVLPSDEGLAGVIVILNGEFGRIEIKEGAVKAGAAVRLSVLAERAMREELSGLEFAQGIPGTLGGGVIGNAGAGGESVGALVSEIGFLDEKGSPFSVSRESLRFSYRSSNARSLGKVVTDVSMTLAKGSRQAIAAKMKDFADKRKDQPLDAPNAGCIFKNPEGHPPAGMLLDQCGLKGLRVGSFEVSPRHANFIVNRGGGTTAHAVELILKMRREVYAKFGVVLETEVVMLDSGGRVVPLPEPAAC